MGYYAPDVYHQPEKFGLEPIGEIEWTEPDYSFDFTVVWKKDSDYYFASDSGCSCPSPFEYYTSIEDLEGPFTKAQLREELEEMAEVRADMGGRGLGYTREQLNEQLVELFSRL